MKWRESIRSPEWLLLIPALIGTVLILVSTSRYGAGISPDSVGYISAARNLARGHGLVLYDGSPLIEQPPLYPAILALFRLLGIDPLAAARIVSSVLMAVIVYLSGAIARRSFGGSRLWIGLSVLAALLSRVVSEVTVMAWTEPLFICFVLLFLDLAERYDRGGERRALILTGVVAALACLTRYAGVTLVVAGIAVVLAPRRDTARPRWRDAGLFLLVSLLPLAGWVVRNSLLSGSPLGERNPASFTFLRNLQFTWRSIAFWYLPIWSIPHRVISTALGALVILFLALGVMAARKKMGETGRGRSIILFFVIVYIVFLLITSAAATYDRIGDRLLAPAFIPLTLLLLLLLRDAPGAFRAGGAVRGLRIAVFAMIAVTLVSWGIGAEKSATNRAKLGAGGYNSAMWQDSPLCVHLQRRGLPADRIAYSNAPDAVYFFAGIPAKASPKKTAPAARGWVREGELPVESWPEKIPASLVWFQGKYRKDQFAPEELERTVRIETANRFKDGTIFVIIAKR
jgi:4-amino-4-deoxy-L-arabinose transferase-like glycosyltransferase